MVLTDVIFNLGPPQDWELEFVVTLFDLLYSSLPSGQGGIECCGNLQKQKILLSVLSMMFEGFYRGWFSLEKRLVC